MFQRTSLNIDKRFSGIWGIFEHCRKPRKLSLFQFTLCITNAGRYHVTLANNILQNYRQEIFPNIKNLHRRQVSCSSFSEEFSSLFQEGVNQIRKSLREPIPATPSSQLMSISAKKKKRTITATYHKPTTKWWLFDGPPLHS